MMVPVAAAAVMVLATLAYFFLRSVAEKRTSQYKFNDFLFEFGVPTPNILTMPSEIYLSLVVPAYNEEERLPIMLDETLAYLQKRKQYEDEVKSNKNKKSKMISVNGNQEKEFTYEIIVVDDGSKDTTSQVVKKYIDKYGNDTIRLIKFKKNRGKGFAIKQGMLRGRGRYLLMLDADAATEISSGLESLEANMTRILSENYPNAKNSEGLRASAIGSRSHLLQEAVAVRAWYRNLVTYVFYFFVNILVPVRGIKDTQCGFKMFTRLSAQECFSNLHIDRFSFDLELLTIAQALNTPIAEVGVNWKEVAGSKLNVLAEGFNMPRDMLLIRLFYWLGFWKIVPIGGVSQ